MTNLRIISRGWKNRLALSIKAALDRFYRSLQTEVGIALTTECPTCKDTFELADPLQFGRAYEFKCAECKSTFVVVIPSVKVIPGTLEVLKINERTRPQSNQNNVAARTASAAN